jgi:signal peptidase I
LAVAGPAVFLVAIGLAVSDADSFFPVFMGGLVAWSAFWGVQLASAVNSARRAGDGYRPRWVNSVFVYMGFYLCSTVGGSLIAGSIRAELVEPFIVSSGIMAPTLVEGDQFFVVKRGQAARWDRGDVVVYNAADHSGDAVRYVKRVIARGGDEVAVEDQTVVVNGTVLAQEPCASPNLVVIGQTERCSVESLGAKSYQLVHHLIADGRRAPKAPSKLEPGAVFLMGDNRDNSNDSRFVGPTREASVVGRAVVVWFSFSRADGVRWRRLGRRL